MKYGAIVKEFYYSDDGYGSGSTVSYDSLKYFDTESELKDFLKEDHNSYGGSKVKKIIKYEELTFSSEIVIKVND